MFRLTKFAPSLFYRPLSTKNPLLGKSPQSVDLFISDIDSNDLDAICGFFNVQRLKSPPNAFKTTFPIKGEVVGRDYRVFFPLVVKKQNVRVVVPFLFATGSLYTFLRKDTLEALGIKGEIRVGAEVAINEFSHCLVWQSHSHFENVDVLGEEFLRLHGLEVRIAPSILEARLLKINPSEWSNDEDVM